MPCDLFQGLILMYEMNKILVQKKHQQCAKKYDSNPSFPVCVFFKWLFVGVHSLHLNLTLKVHILQNGVWTSAPWVSREEYSSEHPMQREIHFLFLIFCVTLCGEEKPEGEGLVKSSLFELSFCVLTNKDACFCYWNQMKQLIKKNIHVKRIIRKEISF